MKKTQSMLQAKKILTAFVTSCALLVMLAFPVMADSPGAEDDGSKGFERLRLPPTDEAGKVPGLKKFRDQLLERVRAKDLEFVLGAVDDNIKCSFGGDGGKKSFIEMWALDKEPEKSEVWGELESALALGGAFYEDDPENRNMFMTPYLFIKFPDKFDVFSHKVALGDSVPVFERPDSKSKTIATLNWDVVKIQYQEPDERKFEMKEGKKIFFDLVTIHTGQTGWVREDQLRSPIDYRAALEKRGDDWKMTLFVAGD